MFKRIIHFIKYNNAIVLILVLIFVAGSGVFAQTEAGQEFIGEKTTRVEGRDNTLLLEADLEAFDMDYRVERIEEDEQYYYVYYTCIDLVETASAWEYQLNEKVRKVSKKLKGDLGEYLAEELKEEYQARIKELKAEKAKAETEGQETRTEVTEYTGLIGKTLAVAEKVFPGYEAVKAEALAAPDVTLSLPRREGNNESFADDLTEVYDDYIARMDPDGDDVLGVLDNCPDDYNPEQGDRDDDGIGDVCDEFLTLEVVEEATSTEEIDIGDNSSSTEEAASSSEEIVDTVAEETASSTEEEFEVEIIDLGEVASSSDLSI